MEMHQKQSRFLSFILRHKPQELNLEMDTEGFVSVKDLISNSKNSKVKFTKKILDEIVDTDNKSRYEYNPSKTKIRACQGHSIEFVKINFQEFIPTSILYHGTSKENYKQIIKSGNILPMGRNKIHLSDNLETASKVGSRHGELKIITIDSVRMFQDGYTFSKSNNDVILADSIPTKYFIHGDNNATKETKNI